MSSSTQPLPAAPSKRQKGDCIPFQNRPHLENAEEIVSIPEDIRIEQTLCLTTRYDGLLKARNEEAGDVSEPSSEEVEGFLREVYQLAMSYFGFWISEVETQDDQRNEIHRCRFVWMLLRTFTNTRLWHAGGYASEEDWSRDHEQLYRYITDTVRFYAIEIIPWEVDQINLWNAEEPARRKRSTQKKKERQGEMDMQEGQGGAKEGEEVIPNEVLVKDHTMYGPINPIIEVFFEESPFWVYELGMVGNPWEQPDAPNTLRKVQELKEKLKRKVGSDYSLEKFGHATTYAVALKLVFGRYNSTQLKKKNKTVRLEKRSSATHVLRFNNLRKLTYRQHIEIRAERHLAFSDYPDVEAWIDLEEFEQKAWREGKVEAISEFIKRLQNMDRLPDLVQPPAGSKHPYQLDCLTRAATPVQDHPKAVTPRLDDEWLMQHDQEQDRALSPMHDSPPPMPIARSSTPDVNQDGVAPVSLSQALQERDDAVLANTTRSLAAMEQELEHAMTAKERLLEQVSRLGSREKTYQEQVLEAGRKHAAELEIITAAKQGLSSTVVSLQSEVNALKGKLEAVEKEKADSIRALEVSSGAAIESLIAENAKRVANEKSLEQKVEALEKDREESNLELEKRIELLSGENEHLLRSQASWKENEKALEESKRENDELGNTLDDLVKQNKQAEVLSREQGQLSQEKHAGLTKELEKLKREIEVQETAFKEEKHRLLQAENQRSANNSEVQRLERDRLYTAFKAQVDVFRTQIQSSRQKYATTVANVDRLQAGLDGALELLQVNDQLKALLQEGERSKRYAVRKASVIEDRLSRMFVQHPEIEQAAVNEGDPDYHALALLDSIDARLRLLKRRVELTRQQVVDRDTQIADLLVNPNLIQERQLQEEQEDARVAAELARLHERVERYKATVAALKRRQVFTPTAPGPSLAPLPLAQTYVYFDQVHTAGLCRLDIPNATRPRLDVVYIADTGATFHAKEDFLASTELPYSVRIADREHNLDLCLHPNIVAQGLRQALSVGTNIVWNAIPFTLCSVPTRPDQLVIARHFTSNPLKRAEVYRAALQARGEIEPYPAVWTPPGSIQGLYESKLDVHFGPSLHNLVLDSATRLHGYAQSYYSMDTHQGRMIDIHHGSAVIFIQREPGERVDATIGLEGDGIYVPSGRLLSVYSLGWLDAHCRPCLYLGPSHWRSCLLMPIPATVQYILTARMLSRCLRARLDFLDPPGLESVWVADLRQMRLVLLALLDNPAETHEVHREHLIVESDAISALLRDHD